MHPHLPALVSCRKRRVRCLPVTSGALTALPGWATRAEQSLGPGGGCGRDVSRAERGTGSSSSVPSAPGSHRLRIPYPSHGSPPPSPDERTETRPAQLLPVGQATRADRSEGGGGCFPGEAGRMYQARSPRAASSQPRLHQHGPVDPVESSAGAAPTAWCSGPDCRDARRRGGGAAGRSSHHGTGGARVKMIKTDGVCVVRDYGYSMWRREDRQAGADEFLGQVSSGLVRSPSTIVHQYIIHGFFDFNYIQTNVATIPVW